MKKLITLSLLSFVGNLITLIGFTFLLLNDATPWYTWLVAIGVLLTGITPKLPKVAMKHVREVVERKLRDREVSLNHVAYINIGRYLVTATTEKGSVISFVVDENGSLLMFENDKDVVRDLIYQGYDATVVTL